MKPGEAESSAGLKRWCEALDWYATLRKADALDLTQLVGRDWQEWYGVAQNRRVFDAVSWLMTASPLCRRRRYPAFAKRINDTYDLSISIAEWRRAEAKRTEPRHRRRLRGWWRTSGGLGLGAITLAVLLWSLQFAAGSAGAHPVSYATTSSAKELELTDGSRVILGQRTRIDVAYSAVRRSVSLIRGQAWFKVRHDPHWPFVVSAGDGTITDAGTSFLVRREPGRVVVAVAAGKVQVTASPPTWRLLRGETGLAAHFARTRVAVARAELLTITDKGVLGPIVRAEPRATDGCRCAPFVFQNKSLLEVTTVLNSISAQPIFVGASAGALRVSGVVMRGELPQWLRELPHALPVKVDDRGAYIRIRTRQAKSRAESKLHRGHSHIASPRADQTR